MDHVTLIGAVALAVIVAFATASPLVRVPVGLLVAMFSLVAGFATVGPAVIAGAAGAVLGRAMLAFAARSARARTSAAERERQAKMAAYLRSNRSYGRTTFLAGAVPLVPARYVFPLLGALRMPLRYALVGAFVGQAVIISITSAIFRWIALWATNDHATDAGRLLGVVAILLLVLGVITALDAPATRRDRRLRWRETQDRFEAFSLFGGTAPGDATPPGAAPHDEELEGEVLGEEVLDGDQDDESGGDAGGPPPSLPPSAGS